MNYLIPVYISKTLSITQVLVDEDTFIKFHNYSLIDDRGYPGFKYKRKFTSLAKQIMGSPPEGFVIDHINRDPYDARRENMRFASKSENALNRGACVDNRSGYRGVSRYSNSGKWRARLKIGATSYCQHGFDTKEQAALKVNEFIKLSGYIIPLNKL